MQTDQTKSMPKCINVLAIDGGGIRGIIPGMLLAEIESRTGKHISELFDVIAGTSTGGILALALSKPKSADNSEPAYKASDLIQMYEKDGRTIFPKKVLGKLRMLFGAEYSVAGLEEILGQYFEDARLKDALTRVIITSYDIKNRNAFFFRSTNAKNPSIQANYDYPMKQVARATSAAPTFFLPTQIPKAVRGQYWDLIDGGVFANNPAMCAYVEALGINPEADICLVSLGTGAVPPTSYASKAKTWGALGWVRPIVTITMEGPGDTVDYQLNRLLHATKYFRFQTQLDESSAAMDNTDPANINRLKEFAQRTIEEQDERIKQVCSKLLENKQP